MKWHYLIAAISFGVISMFRWSDGRPYWSFLFIAASVYYLWGFFNPTAGRKSRGKPSPGNGSKGSDWVGKPKKEELKKYIEWNRKNARNWLLIAGLAVVATVVGAVYFPPLSIFMGAMGIYSVFRYREVKKLISKANLVLENGN